MEFQLVAVTCTPLAALSPVGAAGWADLPLSSVVGFVQLPSAKHVPDAAATESGTGRHLPG